MVSATLFEAFEIVPPTIARPSHVRAFERDQSSLLRGLKVAFQSFRGWRNTWLPTAPMACKATECEWMKSRRTSPALKRDSLTRYHSGMWALTVSQ